MQDTTTKKQDSQRKAKLEGKGKRTVLTPAQLPERIKLGVDVGLRKYAVCRQVDGSMQEPPQMKTPEKFKVWILEQKKQAKEVVVCYEAGFLGFELARWLIQNGIRCLVMSPIKLDEGNKRVETDKLNAQDIVGRLDRYLAGNRRAMTVCRIPTVEEELKRHETRQRQQLVDHRKALEAQGRSLLWQFGYLERGTGRWWAPKHWKNLELTLEETMVKRLKRLKAVIEELSKQIHELETQLREEAPKVLPKGLERAPVGMGWLSLMILTHECMDWGRFKNRRQVGCFGGLVPSEGSTGESTRQGSITKVGNPVVRMVLIEMAWRMVRYQPNCHAVKRWHKVLTDRKAGSRARKKAIVAVARVLGIDLWRMATGRATAEALGYV
jgi:transposase